MGEYARATLFIESSNPDVTQIRRYAAADVVSLGLLLSAPQLDSPGRSSVADSPASAIRRTNSAPGP